MKCFYHDDADGKCSGFWVRMAAPLAINPDVLEMHAINYNMPFPIGSIIKDEPVYIVDFSISPDEMTQLLEITKDVTWIDHHKTAIEKYKDFPQEIRGVRMDGVAGCMLTFCYLYEMTFYGTGGIKPFEEKMTEKAPLFTHLIADWDIWAFKYYDITRYFHAAFESYDFEPNSSCWDMLINNEENKLIEQGKIILNYQDQYHKKYCQARGFETVFDGFKAYALNLGMCNSDVFKDVDSSAYDLFISFSFDGTVWVVSLYSKTIDVSEIAKKHGGGGHKGAAGFCCSELDLKKGGQSL